MKTAYLDCFSGVSGDMFVGALLDAGLPFDDLKGALATLPIEHYELEMKREARSHIFGVRFLVHVQAERHEHRDLARIREIIQGSGLGAEVKARSLRIFEDLAAVEGKIHGVPPEKVRFHEVGAVDSIVDIVGAVYGIERLGIERLCASPLPLGSGFVSSAHGRMPIPAPASVELLKGVPVYDSGLRREMVTPTGAALLKGLAGAFGPMPPMVVRKAGYGAGKADFPDRPNLLRILIGDSEAESGADTVVVLETNLDDAHPEWLGFLMERLFEAGALDAAFIPLQMKKNRPGVQVQVIGPPDKKDVLLETLFSEVPTLGVRFAYSQRRTLERSESVVDSPWGKLKVKKSATRDGSFHLLPEYEACREIALKHKRPLREIYAWVLGLNKTGQ